MSNTCGALCAIRGPRLVESAYLAIQNAIGEAIPILAAIVALLAAAFVAGILVYWACDTFFTERKEQLASLQRLGTAKNVKGQWLSAVLPSQAQIHRLRSLPLIRILARYVESRQQKRAALKLRESCMNDLPGLVDTLSLALGAGLSIDQAFEWYLSSHDNLIAAEFRKAEERYCAGMQSRLAAFQTMAEALQEESVLRFVAALRQAFVLGTPLAKALDQLSTEVRAYRKAYLEESIAKAPVKILVPMGLCIVPAVLIVLMGPIISQMMHGFSL